MYSVIWLIYVSSVTSASACGFINSTIYLHRTASLTPRILSKVYFLLNAEVLQGNTAVFSILHPLIVQETSTGQYHKNYVDGVPKT